MNKTIVLDVGMFDPRELHAILGSVDVFIADGEHAKAWTVLGPMRKKLDKMQELLRDMRLCDITPELTEFNEEIEKVQQLHDNLELEMAKPYEPERIERLAHLER